MWHCASYCWQLCVFPHFTSETVKIVCHDTTNLSDSRKGHFLQMKAENEVFFSGIQVAK